MEAREDEEKISDALHPSSAAAMRLSCVPLHDGPPSKGERKKSTKKTLQLLPLLWNETKNRIRDSVGTLFPH